MTTRRHQLPEQVAAYRELAARAARKITPAQVGLLEENLEQYREARRARALMEQHILASADHLIEILGQRGLWITQDE